MPIKAIDSIDLWYESQGDGRPIVFLHAFAVTGEMWFPQTPALTAAGFETIYIDQRGHGRSSATPAPYSISQMAKDVHQFITSLGLEEVTVVGLSMGGRVALRLALDYPKDIAALVLVSTKSEPAREIQSDLEILAQKAEQGEVESAVTQWYGDRYQRLALYAPDLTRALLEQWNTKSGSGFTGSARAIIDMESMTALCSEIKIPTLSVAGALDTPCLPYLAWYERSIPNCRGVIVPEAAHFVNIEQPQPFNDLLLAFLANNLRNASSQELLLD